MNNYNRPAVPLEDPITSWMSNAVHSMNASVVGLGTGVNSISTPVGQVHNNPLPQINSNKMRYVGNYNESTMYYPNDVVFVDPNGQYSASFSGSTGHPPLTPGLFVCVLQCPDSTQTSAYFLSSVVSAYTSSGQVADSNVANAYQWTQYNAYYPTYPVIPSLWTHQITDVSGYVITANQTYWQPLMPMINLYGCLGNGAPDVSMWVSGIISGSTFNTSYLPYSGSI